MMNVPVMSVKAAAVAPIMVLFAIQVPIVAVTKAAGAITGVRINNVFRASGINVFRKP
jgi:hypothetical protein